MSVRNGFLIVASQEVGYVQGANFAAASIKDFYPEAHVTLFVEPRLRRFVDDSSFDLIVSENVPSHVRTKLYALSRTPYTEMTCYVDADMECVHEDVSNVWDEVPEDCDIMITKIRPYNGKEHKFKIGQMIHHGGFFVYRSNPHTLEFMQRWWDDYVKQRAEPWPYEEDVVPKSFAQWDQFTFWKLLNVDKMPVDVRFFKDDARWNFVNGYYLTENKDPIVFYHHTLPHRSEREYEELIKT
jgi:hypothetical protein